MTAPSQPSSDPRSEPDPDAAHFAQVCSGIYRRVIPESVWSAIQYAVRHQLPAENPTIMIMFVRIAEVYSDVRDYLKTCVSDAKPEERSALTLILDPPEGIRDAEYLPSQIESPGEMDLCWGEFLVTGSLDPIHKIVAVLDREDVSRPMVQSWLNADDESALTLDADATAELASVGIAVGQIDGPWEILSPGDIDILLWLGWKDKIPACLRITEAMTESHRVQLATKGAAMWSLRANAGQHGKIRLFCEEQSKIDGGLGRRLIDPST